MLLGGLHEIETQLNAVASNLPPSTDLGGLAERFKKRGVPHLKFRTPHSEFLNRNAPEDRPPGATGRKPGEERHLQTTKRTTFQT